MLHIAQLMVWALAGSVLALPEPIVEERAVDCKAVNGALTVLKLLGPPATTFCSSYLKVPSATSKTITLPQQTATVTPTTTTVTVTAACTSLVRRATPSFTVERNGTAIWRHPVKAVNKRLDLPALSGFAAKQLSSGCSCLSISPKTTVTAYSTPPSVTVSVTATATATVPCTPPCAPPGTLGCTVDNFIQYCCNDANGNVGCNFTPPGSQDNGFCFQ